MDQLFSKPAGELSDGHETQATEDRELDKVTLARKISKKHRLELSPRRMMRLEHVLCACWHDVLTSIASQPQRVLSWEWELSLTRGTRYAAISLVVIDRL
ncbi:hypothetical protein M413DRAFT_324848 [Hebeloma cylindrosporum]|uniref:Uncharacterized protein n=1 Tax=Hebeloma cylindrosporum TaxID=76867 RepID=A0A0C3BV10_HEBCY|nr:hypothetical protein M413DRAFT_324848 [Hebeloma cylindrosporum h7]